MWAISWWSRAFPTTPSSRSPTAAAKYIDINGDGLVTVSFDANGGEATTPMVPVSGLLRESVEVPECAFTRPGYVFANWSSMPDGSGRVYMPGAVVPLSGRVDTLYAQWKLDPAYEGTPVFVTFDANGEEATGGDGSRRGPVRR